MTDDELLAEAQRLEAETQRRAEARSEVLLYRLLFWSWLATCAIAVGLLLAISWVPVRGFRVGCGWTLLLDFALWVALGVSAIEFAPDAETWRAARV